MNEPWRNEYRRMISACEAHQVLNGWEKGFIASMKRMMDSNKIPSPKQIETLSNLYDKRK